MLQRAPHMLYVIYSVGPPGDMQTFMQNIAMAKGFGLIYCCNLDPVNRLPHQMDRRIPADASRPLPATLPAAGPR